MGAIAPPSYRRSVALSLLLSPPCSTSSLPWWGEGGGRGAGGVGGGRSCGMGPHQHVIVLRSGGRGQFQQLSALLGASFQTSEVINHLLRLVCCQRPRRSVTPAVAIVVLVPLLSGFKHPCTLLFWVFLFPEQPCFGRSVAFNITRGY